MDSPPCLGVCEGLWGMLCAWQRTWLSTCWRNSHRPWWSCCEFPSLSRYWQIPFLNTDLFILVKSASQELVSIIPSSVWFPKQQESLLSDGNKLMFYSCFQHWNFIVSRVYAPLLIGEKMSNREWTSFFFVGLFWAKKLSWYMDILRQLFRSMVGADGWCIHYDKPSRSCTIHNGMLTFSLCYGWC